MAFLAPVLSIAGTLFSGVAALGQANYQAQVARNNAKIADRNANIVSEQAQQAQLRSDRDYAAERGAIMAQQGASGLGVYGTSALAVRELSDRNRRESAVDIRREGEAGSTNFNNEAAGLRGQARAARSSGIASLVGSVIEAESMGADAFGGQNYLGTTKRRARPWSSNYSKG